MDIIFVLFCPACNLKPSLRHRIDSKSTNQRPFPTVPIALVHFYAFAFAMIVTRKSPPHLDLQPLNRSASQGTTYR
jgi:hypothetical protein